MSDAVTKLLDEADADAAEILAALDSALDYSDDADMTERAARFRTLVPKLSEMVREMRAALVCPETKSGRHEWRASQFDGMSDGWCCRCAVKAQDRVDAALHLMEAIAKGETT